MGWYVPIEQHRPRYYIPESHMPKLRIVSTYMCISNYLPQIPKLHNVVYQCAANFLLALSSQPFYYNYLSQFAMPVLDTEARIILAIEAIRSSKTLSRLKASATYNVPETTLRDRMNGRAPRDEYRPPCQKLDATEDDVLSRHILDLDTRGFPPDLAGVEDMANLILASRGGKRVGKL